jgi:hypothetical protein
MEQPFRCWMLQTPWNHVDQGPVFAEIEAAIARHEEFGLTALMAPEVNLHRLVRYRRFVELNEQGVDPAWRDSYIEKTRRFCHLCREADIEPWLFCFELLELKRIAQTYPAAMDPNNSLLWDIIAERAELTYQLFPELAGLEIYVDEGPTINISHLGQYGMPAPEILARLAYTHLRVARQHGRKLMLSTFTNEMYRLRDIRDGLRLIPPAPDFTVNNFVVPGDFGEYLTSQPLIGDVAGHREIITFDFCAENWGEAQMPFCYPDYLAERWRDARTRSPHIVGFNAWAMWSWHYDHPQGRPFILDTPNEVNAFTLAQLVRQPDISVEEIWDCWVTRCSADADAAAVVKSALRRTREIGERAWMLKGFWFMEHPKSYLPGIRFMLHSPYNESTAEWDEAFRPIEQAIFFPTEEFVQSVACDRQEALALAERSLAEVRSVQDKLLPPWNRVLPVQFERLVAFCRTSAPFTELFLRWKLWWLRRPGGEVAQIERCRQELLAMADDVEAQLGPDVWPPNPGRMRLFARQVEQVMAYGQGPLDDWSGIFVGPLAKRYVYRILDELCSLTEDGGGWFGRCGKPEDVLPEVERLKEQLLGLAVLGG